MVELYADRVRHLSARTSLFSTCGCPTATGSRADLRASVTPPPACLLTSHSDDEALFGAIMAGAFGYLLKQISGVDLVGVIRTVAGGGSLLDPTAAAAVLERLRRGWVPDDPRYATLSPQERRILDHIADGRTNRQIGDEMHLAAETGLGRSARAPVPWASGESAATRRSLRQQDRHPGENHAEQHGPATGRRSGRRLGLRA